MKTHADVCVKCSFVGKPWYFEGYIGTYFCVHEKSKADPNDTLLRQRPDCMYELEHLMVDSVRPETQQERTMMINKQMIAMVMSRSRIND